MKRSLIATAALLLVTCPAWSQNVTLAGVADAAVRQVSNSGRGSVSSLVSGANATSRIIIRGTEDLGGGLSAGFHLEHGLLLDAGTQASATQFWDRRSTVSLVSKAWGELRAGRDFVPTYSNWSRYDPFSYVGVGGSNNFISAAPNGPIRAAFSTGLNTTVRSSDSGSTTPAARWAWTGPAAGAAKEAVTVISSLPSWLPRTRRDADVRPS